MWFESRGVMGKVISFQIKSKIENIYSVERAILEQASQFGFDSESRFCLRLAMDEAFVNAIIHGNGNAAEKNIYVKAHCDCDRIEISIRDEGNGFDLSVLNDPREEPFLFETHGRGVFLIRQFTHELHFNDKGNEIIFVMNRAQPSALS
ncbi:MAG: ATP-binding protein [Candidatus Omnitrophota bacterium]|jgi:serine/threonine-protein kinase RsbW|nr:MAG: ATP-binding protein [Candidatus Omnitrophota bacterium]